MAPLLGLTLLLSTASTSDIEIGQSLHGVVLLVTQLGDGLASYGSGVVVDDQGDIVTNLHVLDGARSVHALVYDPARPSYAAVDGGLARLVFEREKELVPVRFVRGDPILDLAVVRLEKPARILPLPIAKGGAGVAVGDPVVALGHPEQNFWTVTRGQVSGLHEGVIQHDAAINKGNSGGALMNAKGEVVGINTSFLKGAQGISYARPVAMITKLIESVAAPVVLDRSTPQRAIESCNHARELGDPSYSQCVNWGGHYATFRDVVMGLVSNADWARASFEGSSTDDLGGGGKRIVLRGGPKPRAREVIRRWLNEGDGRADEWVKRYGPFMLAFMLSDDPSETGRAADQFLAYAENASRGGRPPKQPPQPAKTRVLTKEQLRLKIDDIMKINVDGGDVREVRSDRVQGLKVSIVDIAGLRKTMRMGLRVDEVRMTSDKAADHAWVALSGRNLDGSVYRYSVRMVKAPDGWREQGGNTSAEVKPHPLPAGFPRAFQVSDLPGFLAQSIATSAIAIYLWQDGDDGLAPTDVDLEHTWPAFIESIKRRNTPTGARVATSLEDALKPR